MVLGLVALTGGGAATAGAQVPQQRTAAGNAAAGALLLRGADFGGGWSSTAAPAPVPPLTCPRLEPRLAGVVERGAAASRTFSPGSGGPFVASAAYEFGSASQATTVWQRLITRRFTLCVAAGLTSAGGRTVSFRVTREHPVAAPRVAVARRRAYRVAAMASGSGQTIPVYLDVIVLGGGPAITTLSIASFSEPPPARLERRLAGLVAGRLRPRG